MDDLTTNLQGNRLGEHWLDILSSPKHIFRQKNDLKRSNWKLTWIFESEVRFRFRMFFNEDRLQNVFGQNFVEDVVRRHRQRLLALQQLLDQQRVQVVRVHHVVLSPERNVWNLVTMFWRHQLIFCFRFSYNVLK